MEITLYSNFSKRINSTRRPVGGRKVTATLKNSTSVSNPVFTISGVDYSVNYLQWEGRYYYVDDITTGNNNMYELHCTCDTLATYKPYIMGTDAYVEYASSAYNVWIPDKRLTMTGELDDVGKTVRTYRDMFTLDTEGSYIVTIASNGEASNIGLTSIYAITRGNLVSLSNWLYDDSIWKELQELFGSNPYNAIIDVHWVPWGVSGTDTTIKFGSKDSNIVGAGLSSLGQTQTKTEVTLEIPWTYDDWRRMEPYSQLILHLPFYGNISLPINKIIDCDSLNIAYIRDPISGEICYTVTDGTIGSKFSETFKASTAVSLAVGQTSTHKTVGAAGIVTGVAATAGAVGTLATGGAAAPAIAAAVGGISAFTEGAGAMFSEAQSAKGMNGGFGSGFSVLGATALSSERCISLTMYTHKLSGDVDQLRSVAGCPLFKTYTLSELHGGYIKCSGASCEIPGLSGEKESVNSYLNSGFYLE